jgi:DNA-directed RNA polymerase subunit M/transcription elongation factor TFIIS
MELETTCDNCGNHVKAKGFKEGDVVICYVCNAEFDVVNKGLKYIKNTGERE